MDTAPLRVLLVEDNPDDLLFVRSQLEAAARGALDVTGASSLSECIEQLSKRQFDAVLLDLWLPDAAGLDTLVRLRAAFEHPAVVVLTAQSEWELGVAAVQQGAQDFLAKGELDGTALLRAIRYAVERGRLTAPVDGKGKPRASARRFRQLVDELADGIVVVKPDGTLAFVNPAAAQMLGRPAEELVGSPFGSPIATDAPAELDIVRPDGATLVAELRAHETNWGGQRAFLASLRNITERRRVQRELAKRAVELERSNAELQQFAYVASHDLREPLRAVLRFVELLQQHCEGQIDETASRYLRFAVDGAQRMQALIRDLLEYSRVRPAEEPPAPVPTAELLDTVLWGLRERVRESGAQISSGELPEVLGHRYQLLRLFQNLIENAIKYRREEPPRVHVEAVPDGKRYRFEVRDNGIGFAEEHGERIFRLFQRLHPVDQYGGTGLGLAIAKRILDQLGEKIWVESTPGEGSTFYFTLPAAPQKPSGHRGH